MAQFPNTRLVWSMALALLVLSPIAVRAQPDTDPRRPEAEAQVARCVAMDDPPTAERIRRDLNVAVGGLMPFARDVLLNHRTRSAWSQDGREIRVELYLQNIRDLALPQGAVTYLPSVDGQAILQDRRSRIPALWRVDEATVNAAARAYDIRDPAPGDPASPPVLEDSKIAADLPGYDVVRIYADTFTGFAGLVLQSRPRPDLPVHRIYAIAGTHVFEHTDFRTWASGLTFGRSQFVSTAALNMLRDAAAYVSDMRGGGEVFVTGQSQGGLTSQGLGYLLQSYLDAQAKPHHLAHVVSWGAVGAQETLVSLIRHHRDGDGRGFDQALETHWAATDPDYAAAAAFWKTATARWNSVPPGGEEAHLHDVMGRMRVVGYFFEVDLFARAGTFLGTTFAFPTQLVLPDECELLVAEAVVGMSPGRFSVRLESHFLDGYRRAVARGAIAVSRPALPAKWEWFASLLPVFDAAGSVWLKVLYLDGPATSPANWRACEAAGLWRTRENPWCRKTWWPGCGPVEKGPNWCLIRPEGVTGATIH